MKKIDLAAAMAAVETRATVEITLAELVRAYLAHHLTSDVGPRLKKWAAALGNQSAWGVTSEQLQVATEAMRSVGYSIGSINRDLSALGSVYKWAQKRRMAPRGFVSPSRNLSREAEPIRRIHITPEELQALRDGAAAFRNRHFQLFIALLIDTGARRGEILGRRWNDVNLDAREITAPVTKTGAPRVLFFQEETATLAKRLMPADRSGFMFPGRGGQPADFRRNWKFLAKTIGRPELHLHDLRHAKAASLLKSGVTVAVAAQLLGHSSMILQRRYGHLETGHLKKAAQQTWAAAA